MTILAAAFHIGVLGGSKHSAAGYKQGYKKQFFHTSNFGICISNIAFLTATAAINS